MSRNSRDIETTHIGRHCSATTFRWCRALGIVWWLLLSQAALASSEGIFRGTFEQEGITPLQLATVELRAANETVKAAAHTDAWRTFPVFTSAQVTAGDSIVAYGGTWEGQPFAGEFRLLLDSPTAPQTLGPITTLVAATATSSLVQGTTPAQRQANAVALLQNFGLIDANWRSGSPARVNYSVEPAIRAADGIQNWVAP